MEDNNLPNTTQPQAPVSVDPAVATSQAMPTANTPTQSTVITDQKSGGGSKKLIILLLIFVVIAIVAAAAYFFMNQNKPAPPAAQVSTIQTNQQVTTDLQNMQNSVDSVATDSGTQDFNQLDKDLSGL